MFTYSGSNHALTGFFDAIVLVMENGFAVAAFIAVILNLILPEEDDDEDIPELTANHVDDAADEEEWNHIRHTGGDAAEHGVTPGVSQTKA